MKRTLILIVILIISCFNINAQKKLKNNIFQDENSAITNIKLNTANAHMQKALKAYLDNDIEKSKYYIDQSQRQGVKTVEFYFLLGAYMYKTEEFKAAKRYWKIAFKEGGCWECKELLELLKKKNPLETKILKIVKDYSDK